MGFYLRKSIKVGPLRFNLSKSGVGVSAGVRGARVGMGPRGNYVHVGRHGAYYRATLPGARPTRPQRLPAAAPEPAARVDALEEIESGEVNAMRDSSSTDLLDEFQKKNSLWRIAPFVLGGGGAAVALALANEAPPWAMVVLVVCTVAGTVFAHMQDILRKSVVLLYELEPDVERLYQGLHDGFESLAVCARVWHVEAAGAIRDWKRSAGATEAIQRKGTRGRRAG